MSNPGCFAAASVFAHDSTICQKCHVFKECSKESLRTLETIKGLVNVSDLLNRHAVARKRLDVPMTETIDEPKLDTIEKPVERETKVDKVLFAVTYEQEEIIATLSVKSKEHARRLCANNMIEKIKSELQAGRNALKGCKPEFIAVAIDYLMKNGFSRRELRTIFIDTLGWGDTTASSHVSIVLPLLTSFGIAQESNGRFVVAPALSA